MVRPHLDGRRSRLEYLYVFHVRLERFTSSGPLKVRKPTTDLRKSRKCLEGVRRQSYGCPLNRNSYIREDTVLKVPGSFKVDR